MNQQLDRTRGREKYSTALFVVKKKYIKMSFQQPKHQPVTVSESKNGHSALAVAIQSG